MLKFLTFFVLSVIAVDNQVFAAKFIKTESFKNPKMQNLANTVHEIIAISDIFGDAGLVARLDFIPRKKETDLKIVKQLNYTKKIGGLSFGETKASDMSMSSAEDLTIHLLDAWAEDIQFENEQAFADARLKLLAVITAIKTNPTVKIFGTNHADEDGAWQILDFLDQKNQQILFVKIGYYGN